MELTDGFRVAVPIAARYEGEATFPSQDADATITATLTPDDGAPGRPRAGRGRDPVGLQGPAQPQQGLVVDEADRAAVEALLGRPIQGDFEIVVRHPDGSPVVLRNAPLLRDGTPMPTRYWLVGEPERTWISRLEAAGGVNRAEAEVDPDELVAAHARYAAERNTVIPAGHAGHRPSGGVGGTRTGVKCLHAHYAWYLAGGDDPVGRWIEEHLADAH